MAWVASCLCPQQGGRCQSGGVRDRRQTPGGRAWWPTGCGVGGREGLAMGPRLLARAPGRMVAQPLSQRGAAGAGPRWRGPRIPRGHTRWRACHIPRPAPHSGAGHRAASEARATGCRARVGSTAILLTVAQRPRSPGEGGTGDETRGRPVKRPGIRAQEEPAEATGRRWLVCGRRGESPRSWEPRWTAPSSAPGAGSQLCRTSRGRGKGRKGTRDVRGCTDGGLGGLGGSSVARGARERGTGRADTELVCVRRCFS